MRAISIRQPYASQILRGTKKIEYRTWKIEPGDLVVCASTFGDASDGLPRGVTLCIVDVYKITGDEGDYRWHLRNVRPLPAYRVRGSAAIYHVDLDAASVGKPLQKPAKPRPVQKAPRQRPVGVPVFINPDGTPWRPERSRK